MDDSSSSSSERRTNPYVDFWLENQLVETGLELTGPHRQLNFPTAGDPNLLHHLETPGAADSLVGDAHSRCSSWSSSLESSESGPDSPGLITIEAVHNGISISFDLDYEHLTLEGVARKMRNLFPELKALDFYITVCLPRYPVNYVLIDDVLRTLVKRAPYFALKLNPVIPKPGHRPFRFGLQQPKHD